MKGISISTCFDYQIPIEQQFQMLKNVGFDCVSIGGNYAHSGILEKSGIHKIKALCKEYQLGIDTIHGYAMDKADNLDINEKLAIAAEILGVPTIVLHCSSFTFHPDTYNRRKTGIMDKLPEFQTLAKEHSIKFAFENVLPGVATDFMEDILNHSEPEYFGFCYDSAHDQIDGPRSFDLLSKYAGRLFSVHISDRIKEMVDHVTPGEGFIDFQSIVDILKHHSYDFPLLMEVMTMHSQYKSTEEFLKITYFKAQELLNGILTSR